MARPQPNRPNRSPFFRVTQDNKYVFGAFFSLALNNFYKTILYIFGRTGLETSRRGRIIYPEEKIGLVIDVLRRKLSNPKAPFTPEEMAWSGHFKLTATQQADLHELLIKHFPMLETIREGNALPDTLRVLGTLAQGLVNFRNINAHFNPYNPSEVIDAQDRVQYRIVGYLDKLLQTSLKALKLRNNAFYCIAGATVPKDNGREIKRLSGFGICYLCVLFLTKSQAATMLSDVNFFHRSYRKPAPEETIRELMSHYRTRIPQGRKIEPGNDKSVLMLDILNHLRKCPRELYNVLTPEGRNFFTASGSKLVRGSDRFPQLALRFIDEMEEFSNIRFRVSLGKFVYKFYEKECINGETDLRILSRPVFGYGRLGDIEEERRAMYGPLFRQRQPTTVLPEGEEGEELELTRMAPNTPETKPFITSKKATYDINGNRIGLYWNILRANGRNIAKPGDFIPPLRLDEEGRPDLDTPAPRAYLSIHELPALLFYQYISRGSDPTAEDIIIAKYDGLHSFLSAVEEGRFEAVDSRETLESRLRKEYGLSSGEIPGRLAQMLVRPSLSPDHQGPSEATMELRRYKEALQARLRRQIELRDRMKEDRDNRDGKSRPQSRMRHGDIARTLALSLLEWQPTKRRGRDKLTGLNFSKLQAELATFNHISKFDALVKTLTNARLLGGEIPHPFLDRVVNGRAHNVEELYWRYVNAEIYFLKGLFHIRHNDERHVDSNIDYKATNLRKDSAYGEVAWVRSNPRYDAGPVTSLNSERLRALARSYLERDGRREPLCLPDGLFTPRIVEVLRREYCPAYPALATLMADDKPNNNASYLISAFYETVLDDSCQPFYRSGETDPETGEESPTVFGRTYPLFRMLGLPAVSSRRINEYFKGKNALITLPEAAAMIPRVKANEKAIRRFKTQDMILFLMARALMDDLANLKGIERLKEFRLMSVCDSRFLNQKVDFDFHISTQDGNVVISQHDMPLKNYGELHRLLGDDRLPSLLAKLRPREGEGDGSGLRLSYDTLVGELESYDRQRSRVFRSVHRLERSVIEDQRFKNFLTNPLNKRFFIDDDPSRMPKRNNFRALLMLLEQTDPHAPGPSLSEEERALIISIRNAFSHNHYNVEVDCHTCSGTTLATLIAQRLDELVEGIAADNKE